MAALPDESPVAPPESGPSRPLIPPAVYPWLALLVPLLVYLLGACPVVYVGDAGDFVTASWTLGISHPPGYPLYTLLGWLFTHLPIPGGEAPAAFRMNLMSGVFGAITSYLAYLLLARTTGVPLLALLGALAVTFSRALWTQATITEVYTLNTCFILWQWWLTVRYAEEGRPRRLWIWLLVAMGLSLAHHYSILMFFPFMFWYVVALTGALWPGDRMGIVGGDTKRAGTVGGDVVPAQVRPLTTELWQGLAYVLSPMFLLYCYLPLVKFQTPVSETRPLPYLGKGVGEFLRYWWLDTVGRGVYSYRPQVEGATTTPQVFQHYLKYTYEDQGALSLLIALVLWAALLWRPRPVAEDLPAAMASGPDIRRLHVLTRAFLASVVLFFLVIILVPSGDILHAQQSNLRVVMPPLLIPGHLFLVLAIFTGCGLLWHHLPAYVWGARAKDPMDPAAKLRLSRTLLTVILIGLVGVNAVRNWQYGDRSRSRIAFLYAGNVTRSFAPDGDTLVINTGDETFLYWYLTKVHWDQNPDQALPDLTFTNWIHQIPNYEILAQSTEAELQRDILLFFLKQQLVERASRALGYESDVKHPTGLATTFFRQEFLQVERFKYWDVVMDGLVYHWNIKPEYEIVAIQDILQTEAQAAEWDRLGDEQVDLLQKRVTQILYDESPAYAAHVNVLQGRAERGGGAAAKADPSTVGPLKRNPDGSVEGTVPHPEDPTGPPLLTLSDDQGPIYQVANLPPVEIQYRDRDWWSFYDWRGVLEVEGTGDTAKVEPTTIIYDPQEQEILARYQDLFYQHALRHFKAAIEVSEQLEALPEPSADGRKDPVYAALEAEWSEAMALADRNATTAILFRFHENSELMTTGWGLLGEIKLRLGQYDRAAQAYQFLTLAIDPAEYPNAAADARASLAYCYAQLGQTGLAQRYAAEALVLDPENPMAKALSQGTPSGAAMPGRPGGLRIPPPTNTPETGEAPPPQPNPELPDPADGTTSPTDGSAGQ